MTPDPKRSGWQQIRQNPIDLAKVKITVSAAILGTALSGAGAGMVVSWKASDKWTTFKQEQVERDEKLGVALGKVNTHDAMLVDLKARQDSFDRFCCPGPIPKTVAAVEMAMTLATVAPLPPWQRR